MDIGAILPFSWEHEKSFTRNWSIKAGFSWIITEINLSEGGVKNNGNWICPIICQISISVTGLRMALAHF